MANGYFERGEVYWVAISDFGGNEVGSCRPALIVSTDALNTTGQVIVAYLTRSNKDAWTYCVPTDATNQHSYVKCDTLMTVQTNRLRSLCGTLNSAEQRAVDDVLEKVFDLGYVDDTTIKEKESEIADLNLLVNEARAEVAGIKAEFAKKDEEIASLKMEIEMWQKCYGRCMDMLVDTKVNGDISRRAVAVEPVKVVEPVVVEEPVVVVEELPVETPKDERLDINSCTATALKKIGFSLAMARKIVESRPFDSVEDLKRINGLKATQYRVMEPKLRCGSVLTVEPVKVEPTSVEPVKVEQKPEVVVETKPEETEKVNINTASATELQEKAGFPISASYMVTGYRKKHGAFSCVEDLLKVPQVYAGTLKRCGHLLEV